MIDYSLHHRIKVTLDFANLPFGAIYIVAEREYVFIERFEKF